MPTKKKTKKTASKQEEKIEKQIENIESNMKKIEEITKKKKEEEKKRQERLKQTEEKAVNIREDLKNQLISQNKFGKQFDDMVEDYIFLVRLKEELQEDIALNGIRYETMTGNGYKTDKPNESVQNLLKVNAQMLKILQDLELKAPDEGPKAGDEQDDLL